MLYRLVVNAAGLFLASVLVPGIEIHDWQSLLAGSALFAIVNALLRPLAYFAFFCLIVATLGLFALVVNAAMLGATAWAAVRLGLNFSVDGFWSAVLGGMVISAVSMLAMVIAQPRRRAP
ncbi:MAG: phage holin family protein [Dehalococcoidia bacterium]|nr:phage holin family protein [Dehalococcoidia bacterium]